MMMRNFTLPMLIEQRRNDGALLLGSAGKRCPDLHCRWESYESTADLKS
jgi:hypothetical protein